MKAVILDVKGKEKGKIDLPRVFSTKIREDIIAKVLEAKKTKQPYSPSPVAGKQYSARGKIRHRRHVWQTHYGRGMSRIPRKVMSRRGTQFNWEGAGIPGAKGGPRAHPPKILSMGPKNVNKKELQIALRSAISATANSLSIIKKYRSLDKKDIKELPLIIESEITKLKSKELLKTLKNILGKKIEKIAIQKKEQRAGKGKFRGRKYKKNAGLLLVIGNKEKLKTKAFDVVNTKKLSVSYLAKGGPGRLTMYTEEAIKNLGEKK
ncbi:MAG: 50S ribosomal protein L4 [archaeon]